MGGVPGAADKPQAVPICLFLKYVQLLDKEAPYLGQSDCTVNISLLQKILKACTFLKKKKEIKSHPKATPAVT